MSFLSRLADRAIHRITEWLPDEPPRDPLGPAVTLDPHKNPPDELFASGACFTCHGTGEVSGYTGGAHLLAPRCKACDGTGKTEEEATANRLFASGACGCGAKLASLDQAREHARINGTACEEHLDEQKADTEGPKEKPVMVDENGRPWKGNGCSTCMHWEDDAGGCCHPALVDHQSGEAREGDPLGQDIEEWREGPFDSAESGAILWPYSGQSCPGHEADEPASREPERPNEAVDLQALAAKFKARAESKAQAENAEPTTTPAPTEKKDEGAWREALAALRAGIDRILADPALDARAELARLVAVDHRLTGRKRRKRTHTGCTVPGCESPHRARGYCGAHYQQWMRGSL